jgi:hypothetical protein
MKKKIKCRMYIAFAEMCFKETLFFFTVLGMKDSLSFVLNKTEELMSAVNGLQEENDVNESQEHITVDTDSPT